MLVVVKTESGGEKRKNEGREGQRKAGRGAGRQADKHNSTVYGRRQDCGPCLVGKEAARRAFW